MVLTVDGEVGLRDGEGAIEVDDARQVKDDDARSGGGGDAVAEGAGLV